MINGGGDNTLVVGKTVYMACIGIMEKIMHTKKENMTIQNFIGHKMSINLKMKWEKRLELGLLKNKKIFLIMGKVGHK